MRRHTTGTNTRMLIEQAIANLVNNQAAFVAQQAENNKARLESDFEMRKAKAEADKAKVEADLRFARIEKDLDEIKAVLNRLLPELLAKLPKEVSREIGFKPKP